MFLRTTFVSPMITSIGIAETAASFFLGDRKIGPGNGGELPPTGDAERAGGALMRRPTG
jgi:hypothetical protein